MKYALAVYNNKKKYIIDLSEYRLKTKNISSRDFKNIDEFSYRYNNEEDFLNELIENNIVPEEFRGGQVDIIRYTTEKDKNGDFKVKREKTGIHVKSDDEFIPFQISNFEETDENVLELRSYFVSNIEKDDFLKAFMNTFYYKYRYVYDYSEELYYLCDCLKSNPEYQQSWKTHTMMGRFFDKYKGDYKHLRALWMFRIYYEKSLLKNDVKDDDEELVLDKNKELEEKRIELEYIRETLEREYGENFEDYEFDLSEVDAEYTSYMNRLKENSDRKL